MSQGIYQAALSNKDEIEDIINLYSLKRIFIGKNQDLFSFVMQHQFAREIPARRNHIRLYCRMASLFESDFRFIAENGKFEKLEYAIIYPNQITDRQPGKIDIK